MVGEEAVTPREVLANKLEVQEIGLIGHKLGARVWYDIVDALLLALREPTAGQLKAAGRLALEANTDLPPKDYYQAMIDVLREGS